MSRIKLLTLVPIIGIILLSACGTKPNGPVIVRVTLKDFTIESSVTEFKTGVPYHFIVTNEGQVAHEFMIMPITMDSMGMPSMSGMTMEQRDAMALMMIPQEELPAGATAERDYIFTTIPQGNIEMVCTLAGHFEAGMNIPVTIK